MTWARLRYLLISILLILSVLWLGLSHILPLLTSLPPPSGEFHVGTESFELRHSAHDFTVRCWYPADLAHQDVVSYANPSQNRLWINQAARRLHLPRFLLKNLFDLKITDELNAPLSNQHQKYPAIFFFPVSAGSATGVATAC